MGIRDVTGVFSRYFIVGYFLPSFFVLAFLKITLSDAFLPHAVEDDGGTAFARVGAVALLTGLILLGLRVPLLRVLSGYFLESGGRWARPFRRLGTRFKDRQLAEYDRLLLNARPRPNGRVTGPKRTARHQLDTRFPRRERVRPTELGNAIRAWEDYRPSRWSLPIVRLSPHVNALATDQEVSARSDADSDFAFFVNGLPGAVVGSLVLWADAIAHMPSRAPYLPLYALTAVVAVATYRAAVGAATRVGWEDRASYDMHRLELYRRFGLREPTNADEEEHLGKAIEDKVLFRSPLPCHLRRAPEPDA